MRIIITLAVMLLAASQVMGSDPNSFESFVKSREIIATLYFNSNAEILSESERDRLISKVQQLRLAQKNGRMIRVEGFSSTEGDQEKNFILSFFRARAVADIIESKGLPSEVTLTGYGDLRADTNDHAKERRVEIASYLKPVGMKKVKVADKDSKSAILSSNSTHLKPDTQEIDSYRVDQAIRSKVVDQGDFAEQWDMLDSTLLPGLSQSEVLKKEIERVYSLWRQSVAPAKSQKLVKAPSSDLQRSFTRYIQAVTPASNASLTRTEKADDDLKRGYSQVKDAATPETSPGLTRTEKADDELKRGYSQVKDAATPETSPGLTRTEKADDELKRGYSQVRKVSLDKAPGVTMVVPQAPVIDALMVEHAIMEKIGVKPTAPSGSVSKVDTEFQQ